MTDEQDQDNDGGLADLPPGHLDQVDAAIADTRRRTARHVAPGRRVHSADRSAMPAALAEIQQRFASSIEDGTIRACAHLDPARPEPVHWLASRPAVMTCERCAQPHLAAFETGVGRCDRCRREHPHDVLRRVHFNAGIWIIHTALCKACFPEGGDLPADALADR